jgi:hypothetical protein
VEVVKDEGEIEKGNEEGSGREIWGGHSRTSGGLEG